MKISYIYHSSFLVETDSCYYLFDYEKGTLPKLDITKPILVLSSHGHQDHYNAELFSVLDRLGMQTVYGVLADDIEIPANVNVLQVSSGMEYELWQGQKLHTFQSTDLGVAFLIEDQGEVFYHAGDLNDWVWDEEGDAYNAQMTKDYRRQMDILADILQGRELDAAFVVLDPRQEKDYDRGMCYFLEHISAKKVYPMHYWESPEIIETFLKEHPEYNNQIERTE